AGLAGSVMVSYTKARAESIGVECNVGMMERPERLICLIAGAVLDVMEPALWVLAVLANLTAVQRIVFTRRMMRAEPRRARVLLPLLVAALLLPADVDGSAETERAWARAQAALRRLLERYPDVLEVPEALYLLGQTAEARGNHDVAALAYRQLRVLAPTTGYAEAASDRLGVLVTGGTPLPPLSMAERIDRAERLLRGGVPKTAGDEAERIADEARDAGIVVRALRVVGDAAARLGRYEAGAKALEAAARHAPSDQQPR